MSDGNVIGTHRRFIVVREIDPIYCPVCGYHIARDMLAEEAEEIVGSQG